MSALNYTVGRDTYRHKPIPAQAAHLNDLIRAVARGEIIVKSSFTVVIVTDLLEDADDTALAIMLDRNLSSSGIKFIMILSGGLCPATNRFLLCQALFPGIEVGVEYKNYLTVYLDGYVRTEPYEALLMAGPCHSTTFRSLCAHATRVVTFVGTDESGKLNPSLPAPINCKKTDVDGALTADAEAWNASVDLFKGHVTALPPEIGRHIALPADFTHPILEQQQALARLMNLTSRVPPSLGPRLHEANATVVGKWPDAEFTEERYSQGLLVAGQYLDKARETLTEDQVDKLRVPVTYVITEAVLRGAVYLPGKFGSPSKTFTDFLTPESIQVLNTNLAGLPTPMYDVGGLMVLLTAMYLI